MGREIVITDRNYLAYVKALGEDTEGVVGCLPRQRPYGLVEGVAPVSEAIPLIPRAEWPARIRARQNQSLRALVDGKIPCLYQNGLGYCHAYATVLAAMTQRLHQGQPFRLLSPESIGGPITGWRNRGASLEADLRQIRDAGACEARYMDRERSIEPRRWAAGWEANRALYRAGEWWDCEEPRKVWDWCVTLTLLDAIWVCGFSWWGHAVVGGYDVRLNDRNQVEVCYRNSHGEAFGENGFFWMQEGKGTPDLGLFAIRSMVAA